jgi:hypothetical protein
MTENSKKETKNPEAERGKTPVKQRTLAELVDEGQRNRVAFEIAAGSTKIITNDDMKFRCR